MSRKKITIDKSFSNRLKTLIENRLGITQAAFSNKIGISQGYLSMVLKGVRGASAELIAGLYIHYDNYLRWLLTGEGEMIRKSEKEGEGEKDSTYIYKEEVSDILHVAEPEIKYNAGVNLKDKLIYSQEKIITNLEKEIYDLKAQIETIKNSLPQTPVNENTEQKAM